MQSPDAADEEKAMYGQSTLTGEELDEKYPNRPHNHSVTLPFHTLFAQLFNPLNEIRKKPTGSSNLAKRKQGPHGPTSLSPHEARRHTIERFISRWRKEVGNDFYPAFRLIVPEKDRDRAMYGLKEKTIGKLLVRVIGIDKNSEDAQSLMNWKSPLYASASAGDFAARCGEVIGKRPVRTIVGDMGIGEVNVMLDKLSMASKEEEQFPLFERFYRRMNAEELVWLIRIILRQMKVGATEKTFFELWHPDAENLFNVSSSLKRVCWELWDPNIRLEGDKYEITLMQCFQPQLAAFQMNSFQKMVEKMKTTEEDPVFWIEEKLDGERMQLHMVSDESVPGGKRFAFWSRKAKDYTYLYGNGFYDENSALTRHLTEAFKDTVRNIILDGEMITWDMEQDSIVAFGTLKTAALSEQRNPYSTGQRPLYRVFDCLYLNDMPITKYTLRDRRRALEASVCPVNRRLEIHPYKEATKAEEIEPLLRQVVAETSEGLLLKNPRSMYKLNERSEDWVKVKPEYMTEFGEAVDCVVVGGYYGSGDRGGRISSYMCGLRVDQNQILQGAREQKTFSFFKVGGGFSASDYKEIAHRTEGKWNKWDPKKPPTDWIELGGGERQFERPDVWIKPEDSVVVSAKASSVHYTDQFRVGLTLRFPRFKRVRTDKTWRDALSIQEFIKLKADAEKEHAEKEFEIDDERRKRRAPARKKKRPLVLIGEDEEVKFKKPFARPDTKVFEGLNFFIITESLNPEKKTKSELEAMVKANGGTIVQSQSAKPDVICVADREPIKVRSIKKEGKLSIVRPSWLFDCIRQSEIDHGRPSFLLPMEPSHMYHATPEDKIMADGNIDEFGDSYCRDVTTDDLRRIFEDIPEPKSHANKSILVDQLLDHGIDLEDLPEYMFHNCVVYLDENHTDPSDRANSRSTNPSDEMLRDLPLRLAGQTLRFASGIVASSVTDIGITHIITNEGKGRAKALRQQVAQKSKLPRIVTSDWVSESWKEKTLLDEERFVP